MIVILSLFFIELFLLFLLSRFLTQSVSKLFFRITKSTSATINLLALLFLPGVVIHELAHLITAGVLFVPTGAIEFMPKMQEGGVKLGSVAIAKTDPLRRALIGLAPILVGIIILMTILFYATSNQPFLGLPDSLKLTLTLYILFEVGNTMFSSRKDVEGILELLILFILLAFALYFVGIQIPKEALNTIFSDRNIEFIKQANILLLIPLGIDVVVIGGTRLIIKN